MSQDSTGSEESLTLSEGTYSELRELVGPELKSLGDIYTNNDMEQGSEIQEEKQQVDTSTPSIPVSFQLPGQLSSTETLLTTPLHHHDNYQNYVSQPSCSYEDPTANSCWSSGSSYHLHSDTIMSFTVPIPHNTIPTRQQYTPILPRPLNQASSLLNLPLAVVDNVPLDQDLPGPFRFDIDFERQNRPAPKGCRHAYSHKVGKLFAKKNVEVPIKILLKEPPSELNLQYLSVKVAMAYSNIEDSRKVVHRCPNHGYDKSDHSQTRSKHIIASGNAEAHYATDETTGQHFYIIPFKKLETGHNFMLELVRFMCLNTCPGGPDRREFHVVFTLLYNGQFYGRKILKTNICSTPGRSLMKSEEKADTGKSPRQKGSTIAECVPRKKCKVSATTTSESTRTNTEPEPDESSVDRAVPGMVSEEQGTAVRPVNVKQEDDDELFTIQVRGRTIYEYLMKTKEAFELMQMIPPEIIEQYRASCPPCGPNSFLQRKQNDTSSGQQLRDPSMCPPNVRTPSTSTMTTVDAVDNQQPNSNTSNSRVRYTLKNHVFQRKYQKHPKIINLMKDCMEVNAQTPSY